MLFNSLQFFSFFIIIYGLYLASNHRWQNRLLILASCIFYSYWSWKFLLLMLSSISIDYFCSQKIYESKDLNTKKKYLFLSILVNLSILGFFKYCNFFLNNFVALISWLFPSLAPHSQIALNILLPIGISFYTFEAISYTVDVYRGIIKPAKNYWDYVLFVIYFPHLLAGPIMRAKDFLPQITSPRVIKLNQFYEGCFLTFWGLFEKIFVADNLAKIVDPVFNGIGPYNGAEVSIAVCAFAFQIFCDFDGYSNIARGLGKCMGFEITINFNLPYFATNPQEFWQRWHISLSSWLRDYLYIPLGGNKNGKLNTLRNLSLTMLLGGLWHGASWTFILWGAYHGLWLIIHRFIKFIVQPSTVFTKIPLRKLISGIKIFSCFCIICFGWLIFRAQSIGQILAMLNGLLFNFSIKNSVMFDIYLSNLSFYTGLLILVQALQFYKNDLMIILKLNAVIRALFYFVCFYLILLFGVQGGKEFIYFQF